jgi:hypothetical protein
MQSNTLTRDAILAASDQVIEAVDVPEWGGVIHVRSLTGAQRDQFEATIVERNGKDLRTNVRNLRARLVVLAACDEHGMPIFKPDDAGALGAKSAAALDRLFSVAQRLSGLRDNDVQELASNFDATHGDA